MTDGRSPIEDDARAPAATAASTRIGPFVVRRKLGEGGMGLVYAGFDPTLGREVALKVIRHQLLCHREVRARMLREAQAMARLSHPNVVQVYQAGEHGDEIYVAMEYVEGQTLASWLRAETRSWKCVLRTVIAAGRGLAAAHAAGLVHRDFKPDNILVGVDGRPRVVDFGLVHTDGPAVSDGATASDGLETFSRMATSLAPGEVEPDGGPDPERLTKAGSVLGTPVYMSPEQHFGGVVSAPSDQFSFSITLYEALYGSPPFDGATWHELRQRVRQQVIPPPPRDSAVPRRIFRILVRGLAWAPDRRWPSLAHMLDALERDPHKTILRAAGIAAVAGTAAIGSYAIALSQYEATQCQGAAKELIGVWDGPRADAAERAFMTSGSPVAADTWRRVNARLDAYADAWIAGRIDACDAHANGSQSTGLFDLRTACLARRRAHLSALVDVFVVADRSMIEHAVQATAALPSIDSCTDADALLAAVTPPDDPETAAQVEAWRTQLGRLVVLEGIGQYAEGLELARKIRAAAEELRYPPLAAEAALGEGSLLMAIARHDEADEALTEALKIALVHRLDAVAAEAAARRIFVLGEGQGRRVAALANEPVAEALAERARDDGRIAALLHNNLGAVYNLDGADERAREHYLRTLDILGRRTGAADPLIAVVHHNLGFLLQRQQRLDESREHYEQALQVFSELLGEHHPLVAHPLGGLADLDLLEQKNDPARAHYSRALALMEEMYGRDHLYLLLPLVGLGKVSAATDDLDAAIRHFRRAVAIGDKLNSTHPLHGEALAGLAGCIATTDPAEARTLLTRAVTVYEADGGPKHPAIAPLALRAAQLAIAAGDQPAARRWLERILTDRTGPKEHVLTRAHAALELARILTASHERARVCTLATEARVGLPAGDPRRAEADALHAATCPRP